MKKFNLPRIPPVLTLPVLTTHVLTLCTLFFVCMSASVIVMPGKARAQERILSFDVQADIYRNGDVYIREDIRVISEHNQIKRGIYRDLPDKYEDKLGNVVRTPLDIISISRDGQIEDYHTARMSNGVRIYIGNKNVIIPEGEHLYSIKYSVERAVGFFDDIA